jgi:hypothetical protein
MEREGRVTRLRRGYGVPSIEGKVTRVGASKPGGERVSIKNRHEDR